MAGPAPAQAVAGKDALSGPIGAADTARYTRDMLETLKRIAVRQDQIVLARLLEAASREAERLVRGGI